MWLNTHNVDIYQGCFAGYVAYLFTKREVGNRLSLCRIFDKKLLLKIVVFEQKDTEKWPVGDYVVNRYLLWQVQLL